MLLYFAKNTINGGVAFHNSGHRFAFGHVNDPPSLLTALPWFGGLIRTGDFIVE